MLDIRDIRNNYEFVKERLSVRGKEYPLEELKETWMSRMHENCIFISARERNNIEELKQLLYQRVKEIHVTRFPYNDFLFEKYDSLEEDNSGNI